MHSLQESFGRAGNEQFIAIDAVSKSLSPRSHIMTVAVSGAHGECRQSWKSDRGVVSLLSSSLTCHLSFNIVRAQKQLFSRYFLKLGKDLKKSCALSRWRRSLEELFQWMRLSNSNQWCVN